MVAAGSSDRFVYIWDTTSRRILYKLPGHLGSVNDVDFHKLEPISKFRSINNFMEKFLSSWPEQNTKILSSRTFLNFGPVFFLFFSVLSAGSDKNIYLGEFEG